MNKFVLFSAIVLFSAGFVFAAEAKKPEIPGCTIKVLPWNPNEPVADEKKIDLFYDETPQFEGYKGPKIYYACQYDRHAKDEAAFYLDFVIFADATKNQKIILTPIKKFRQTPDTESPWPQFVASKKGNRIVLFFGPKNNPTHSYLIDVNGSKLVRIFKGAIFALDDDGDVAVLWEKKGYSRIDLKTKEKNFLFKGMEFFFVNSDGSVIVAVDNQCLGVVDEQGRWLDNRGIKVYRHKTKEFFLIKGKIDFNVQSINEQGDIFGQHADFEYKNGTYVAGRKIDCEIKKMDKIVFKPSK